MVHDEQPLHDGDPQAAESAQNEPIWALPSASRPLVLSGVVGACALGVGLGLWARPAGVERHDLPVAAPVAATPAPTGRRLAIVVDDTPAPVGKPMEVMRQAPAPTRAAPPPPAEPLVPTPPPNGLVRVNAPLPAQAVAAVAPVVAAARIAKAAPTPAHVGPHPHAKPKLAALPKASPHHAKPKPQADEAAEEAPAPKPRHGLAAIAHAIAKLAPRRANPAPPVEQADAEPAPRHKAPVREHDHEKRLAKVQPKPHLRPDPQPAPVLAPRGGGPIRVASVSRCASADPGEALACGDPGLSAAERRMARAYREAEAAGVPAATLEQQQQRWRQARAAAAREAPWAVREVYQARIAELQDQARDARGD